MIRKIVHRLGAPVVCVLMMSGCSVLDNIELSGNGAVYDPNKIYLRNEFFTVRNRRDMDRFVCVSGPLVCERYGMTWDCVCSAR